MSEDRRRPSHARLPSDMDLWQRVAREVKPLKRDRTAAQAPPAPEPVPGPEPSKGRAARLAPPPPKAVPPATRPPLSHGSLADMDRRTAQRLQRGRLPIEATLDLHGMTQAAAHDALAGFILRSEALGRRCVLVVTGKGSSGRGFGAREAGGGEPGVLRRQVPLWLNQLPLRARVLAFDFARPEHGGTGALYVLLKRRREPR